MSINLTATTHALELETLTTVETHVTVSGRNKVAAGTETPISQTQLVNTAAQTTILAAPTGTDVRLADDIEISIFGTGTQSIRVEKDVSGTEFTVFGPVLLGTAERAHYTNDMGWRVFDSFGREKGIPVGYSQLAVPTVFATAGAYTYNVPLGCTAVLIELWGGGGGGGGTATPTVAAQASSAAGGSAGGYVRRFLIGVPTTLVGTIGSLGGGGAIGAAGTAGTATTCTSFTPNMSATGGTGGTVGGALGAGALRTGPPAAVSGTGGDENTLTEAGGAGIRMSGLAAFGGRGGLSDLGDAGAPGVASAGGAGSGNTVGGGGGSIINGSATAAGGAGTPGYARFTPYTG